MSAEDARTDVSALAGRAAACGGELAASVAAEVRRSLPLATDDERRRTASLVLAHLTGLGRLDDFLCDPAVDEILVNGGDVWVERHGHLEPTGPLGDPPVEQIVERILAPLGRRLDRTSPIVDARLADGSRLCAVIDPVAVSGSLLSIRKFPSAIRPLADFADDSVTGLCQEVLSAGCNVVVSGATSSGKTSLLAALVDHLPPAERLVVIEDTTELPLGERHVVRLEARQESPDGPPPIDVADLVRTALRLRPDRLVVGEVRGREVVGLLQALNTGHDGSLSTCHANSTADALHRLATLTVLAAPQWPHDVVVADLHRTVDVVVHVARRGDRSRRIVAIDEVGVTSGRFRTLAALDPVGRLRQVAPLERRRR